MITKADSPARSVIGHRVVSITGRWLGTVTGISDGTFRMKPIDGDAIWLRADSVFNARDGVICLMVDEDGLHRFLVSEGAEYGGPTWSPRSDAAAGYQAGV